MMTEPDLPTVADQLQADQPAVPSGMDPHGEIPEPRERRLARFLPYAAASALGGLIVAVLLLLLATHLNLRSDKTVQSHDRPPAASPTILPTATPTPSPVPTLVPGTALWHFHIGSAYGAETVAADGTVFVATPGDASLYALDAKTGGRLWAAPHAGGTAANLGYANGVVYTAPSWGDVVAVKASDGSVLWQKHLVQQNGGRSGPVVINGVVYIGVADANDGDIFALNAVTGEQLWSYHSSAGIFTPVAVVNGVVYAASGDSFVTALTADQGALLWHVQTPGMTLAADGNIVVVSHGFHPVPVVALDPHTGSTLWSREVVHLGQLDVSAPAIEDKVVYLPGGDGVLYALDEATGNERWHFAAGGTLPFEPTVVGGTAYVGSSNGRVYAIDSKNGAMRWSFETGGPVDRSTATVSSGVVYIASSDGNLYAIAG